MVDFILHVTASGERTDETLAELARRLDRGPLARTHMAVCASG
jgi:hypothetical protein